MSYKNTIQLLRIPFSFFLMPLFFLALSQTTEITIFKSVCVFIIVHVLVYPSSNGYNSYVDRDTTSIGGLEKPPMPTLHLFYLTLILDALALILSFILISSQFAFYILLYILASRAYSAKQIRLKKYPIVGFLIVAFFQGAFTYLFLLQGIAKNPVDVHSHLFILIASSFQIAGVYPLTQVYQHQADLKDGVVTLSYKLGYKGTFMFTALMFTIATLFYFLHFNSNHQLQQFYILQAFFIPALLFFAWWFKQVLKDTGNANFKNTMRMNLIASLCLNTCFILLTLLK